MKSSKEFLLNFLDLYREQRVMHVEAKLVDKKPLIKKSESVLVWDNRGISENLAIAILCSDSSFKITLHEKDNELLISTSSFTDGHDLHNHLFESKEIRFEESDGEFVFLLDNNKFVVKMVVKKWKESLEESRNTRIERFNGDEYNNRHFVHHLSLLEDLKWKLNYHFVDVKFTNKKTSESQIFENLKIGSTSRNFQDMHAIGMDNIDEGTCLGQKIRISTVPYSMVQDGDYLIDDLHKMHVRFFTVVERDKAPVIGPVVLNKYYSEKIGKDDAQFTIEDDDFKVDFVINYNKPIDESWGNMFNNRYTKADS
ncbi:hypothetical protein AU074_13995 [Pseudomonas sp. ATCC PTA-122608]|uniref:hypothetical protein n=1 Tax=Pseudomonas sp. ATCC PTA-122608 TaxID=1771311 RepID=UPI00096BAEBD|nr:hypothetical protein [Pseudomonas sp. ATCC PTA-122608]OLY72283.1 hypothetical protein AU074_13995 [Pseudomonas sp. ATCC PTA-122608]